MASASRDETVRRALLDYYEAPGKHRLPLRQPAILFSSVPAVLQLAAARSDAGGPREARLREAARFFIRAAMLYPGADHYALFGLESRREPVELKERYRLVMRLIHPDFAAAGEWPADAAFRVNRAYEVLSSPVQRRAYDEQLAAQRGASGRPDEAGDPDARRARLRRFATAAIVAAAALGALLILAPSPRPVNLVQKRPAMPAPADALPPPAAPAPVPALIMVEPMPPQATPALLVPARRAEPPMLAAAPSGTAPAVPAPAPAQPVRALAVAVPAPEPLRSRVAPVEPPPPVAAALHPPPAPSPAPRPPEDPTSAAASPARLPAVALAAARPAAAPPPTLSEVQPLLSHLLETLESGSGERVLALLDPSARKLPSALALSRQYEDLVRGGAPVRLAHGDFRSESRNGVLHVTGVMRIHAGEPTIASQGQRFAVRAEFAMRDGKAQLTGLSGAGD